MIEVYQNKVIATKHTQAPSYRIFVGGFPSQSTSHGLKHHHQDCQSGKHCCR